MTDPSRPQQGEDAGASPHGPISNLLHSLTQVLVTLVTMAQTRLELFGSELQDEVRHAAQLLLWGFIALLAAGMTLFLGSLAVIFVFWDSHRLLAAMLVTLCMALIAAVAGWVLLRTVRHKPRMFDATLTELDKDRQRLQQRVQR